MGATDAIGVKITVSALMGKLGITGRGVAASRLNHAEECGFLKLVDTGKGGARTYELGKTSAEVAALIESGSAGQCVFPKVEEVLKNILKNRPQTPPFHLGTRVRSTVPIRDVPVPAVPPYLSGTEPSEERFFGQRNRKIRIIRPAEKIQMTAIERGYERARPQGPGCSQNRPASRLPWTGTALSSRRIRCRRTSSPCSRRSSPISCVSWRAGKPPEPRLTPQRRRTAFRNAGLPPRTACKRFVADGWGDQAALLGWTSDELYRVPPVWAGSTSPAPPCSSPIAGWSRSPRPRSPSRRLPGRCSSFAGSDGSIWRDRNSEQTYRPSR